MVVKFEVGKIYYSVDAVWNKEDKVVSTRRYWLCVKRNDATKYVSFKRVYKDGKVSSSVESRKATVQASPIFVNAATGKSESFEKISIGYGGTGYWRNHHVIASVNVKR